MRSNPSKRNHEFLFEFHNEHGHKILDCRVLQNEVTRLLKEGYLTKLFGEKGKKYYMKNHSKEGPRGPSPKQKVNVIFGGQEFNGVTYTTTKKVS